LGIFLYSNFSGDRKKEVSHMAVIMKLNEVPTRKRYEGNDEWITRVLVGKSGAAKDAKDFGVLVQDAKAGSVPWDKKLHYHSKQETLFFVLSGRCIINVEGKEYELGPDSALWIPSGEKHGLTQVLEDVKLLAVVSNPHHSSDVIESKQPVDEEYPGR
jgi:mannose-6-phosphate isomerase-like protein (cupin superfamily)